MVVEHSRYLFGRFLPASDQQTLLRQHVDALQAHDNAGNVSPLSVSWALGQRARPGTWAFFLQARLKCADTKCTLQVRVRACRGTAYTSARALLFLVPTGGCVVRVMERSSCVAYRMPLAWTTAASAALIYELR